MRSSFVLIKIRELYTRRNMVDSAPSQTRDRPVLAPAQLEAGEQIFADWKSENWCEIHEDGGLDDVAALLARLAVVFS